MSVYRSVIKLCFILVLFPQQGDPDDPDAGNLGSVQDDPDAENLSSQQGFEGIYIHIHSAAVLYC